MFTLGVDERVTSLYVKRLMLYSYAIIRMRDCIDTMNIIFVYPRECI